MKKVKKTTSSKSELLNQAQEDIKSAVFAEKFSKTIDEMISSKGIKLVDRQVGIIYNDREDIIGINLFTEGGEVEISLEDFDEFS